MFDRYGGFIVRRARLVLVATLVVFLAAAAIGVGAFSALQSGGNTDPRADSTTAQQLVDNAFGGQTNLVLLVTAKSGTVDSPAAATTGRQVAADLARQPDVQDVVSYWGSGAASLRSTDRTEALIVAHIAGDSADVASKAKPVIAAVTGDRGAVTVSAGGVAGTSVDITKQVNKGLALAESIAIPVTALLLIFVFGSLVAALLPLAVGVVAIVVTLAELRLLNDVTAVSIYAVNLTTALGLGLGIDYALLMVSRFRERLAEGDDVPEAVTHTLRTAGRTIVFSGATVAAALAALAVFPEYFLSSFAYAGIGVVVIAVVEAVLVLPALLAVLGRRVDAGRLPWARRPRSAESLAWRRIAATVTRRPLLAAVPVVALLVIAAAPLLGISFSTPDQDVLSSGTASRQVATALRTGFGGDSTNAVDIVVTDRVSGASLASYAGEVSRIGGISTVQTSIGAFADGARGPAATADPRDTNAAGQQLLTATLTGDAQSAASQDVVRTIRALTPPEGAKILVGGTTAQLIDTKHSIGSRLPWGIALVVFTTFVVLFLFTGSVVQPLRALLCNVLSISATLGVMTWIYQSGHLASLLGFTPRPMDTSMTVLLFCIVFGLSMDYEVFITSRIKEYRDAGAAPREAVVNGLSHTGRIVSAAAGLLAVTFFSFGTSSVSFIQMFGLGSGLAILIDATLVRGVLVPAVLRLLGAAAWYAPAPLRRLHARVGLSEGAAPEAEPVPVGGTA